MIFTCAEYLLHITADAVLLLQLIFTTFEFHVQKSSTVTASPTFVC